MIIFLQSQSCFYFVLLLFLCYLFLLFYRQLLMCCYLKSQTRPAQAKQKSSENLKLWFFSDQLSVYAMICEYMFCN